MIQSYLTSTLHVIIGIGKAVWKSTLSILHFMVYSFILITLINYYKTDISSIPRFMNLLNILVFNWNLFWWIFFASNILNEWRNIKE